MNTKDRLWSLGAGLVAVGIAVGAWFGSISPDLAATSTARGDLETVEHQNTLHELRIVTLEEAAARMDEYEASRAELAEGVPADLQYAEFLRQVDALALEAGVAIDGVTSAEAVAYLPPVEAEAAPAPEAEPPAEGTEADPAAEPADAGAAGADGAADASAEGAAPPAPMPYVDPLIGPQNLAAVPFTISATGGTAALESFLHELQMGTRLVSISGASLAPDSASETEPGADAAAGTPWTGQFSGHLYVLQPEATTP